jgi:alkyl hydroperoxide reductase subunit F
LMKYGVPVIEEGIVEYHPAGIDHEVVLTNGETYRSKAVIIATGAIYRSLHVPGEYKYVGLGVSYCAICDAPLFRNKKVLVAGGGNSAVEAALDLSKYASSVTLIHRSQFRADKVLLDEMKKDPKIAVQLRTRIVEVIGEDFMSGVMVENLDTGEHWTIDAKGLFIEIGQTPNSEAFKGIIPLSEQGAILTDSHMATSIPGVFAAGNVREFPYKQIIIAAGEGAVAALSASDYIGQKYGKQ